MVGEEEKINNLEQKHRRRGRSVFPNSLGVTGRAFRTRQIIYSNQMDKLTDFLPSVDNQANHIKDVHSLMIVPIYGHQSRLRGAANGVKEIFEDPSSERQPIGMIQFINKTDLKQIDDYDLQKVEAMGDLLGMSIDNASEHHAVINAKVGV